VMPYVIFSIDFWLSVTIYCLGRLSLTQGWFEPTALGDFRGLGTMGFVLALMLSFYVNTSVTRLFETNRDAMNLVREINDLALALHGYLWDTEEQREIARRCLDYICSAHCFAYTGFAEEYTTENLWEGFNEEYGLLTDREDEFIKTHREVGGSRMRECIAWTMEELHLAVAKGFIPPPIANGINQIVAEFNDHAQSLFDFRYLPIPFVSEHLLVFFLHLYLPVQTFEMSVQTEVLKQKSDDYTSKVVVEVFGALLALLANIGFQGLFAVGSFLEQPYGNKICHSRVSSFCRIAVKESRKTYAAGDPRTDLPPLEENANHINQLRADLGSSNLTNSYNADFDDGRNAELIGVRVMQDMLEQRRAAAARTSDVKFMPSVASNGEPEAVIPRATTDDEKQKEIQADFQNKPTASTSGTASSPSSTPSPTTPIPPKDVILL